MNLEIFHNKTLLITGGTGSFGSTILKKFKDIDFKEIRVFSRDEKKQHDLRLELNDPKVKFFIGDVRDTESVDSVVRGVDYIFHAAALKQVPACEFFPLEATKTNVIGTSNVTGSDTQWQTLAGMAKQYGMTTCVDVCQTVGSHNFDVTQADIDFAVFSGHKMYGPVGIGALYVKHDVNELRAVRSGGGTINHYDLAGNIEWVDGPEKHEPGTPNIAGIIGMGVAAEWINYIGYEEIGNKIREVSSWLHEYQIHNIAGLRPLHYNLQTALLPELASVSNIISFVPTAHPSDIGAILGSRNVAVRAGKLCAHPCVNKYSSKGVLRVSWSIYNTKEDCKLLVEELCKAIQKLT